VKTIGVLGGMGPQATMDFEQRVHRVAQQTIPPHFNSGYPPMIVLYHRRPPVVIEPDGTPRKPITLDPALMDSARAIGAAADFLVILANVPHLIQPQVEQASGRKVLSMIDVTLEAVRARGWKRVGAVGLGVPTIYTDRFAALGITAETLAPEQTGPLDRAIFALMEGRETDASRRAASDAITALRARAVDGIILGCTEIPLLLGAAADAPDLLNPAQLLAEAAVAKASE
jgi:aspartate racemase